MGAEREEEETAGGQRAGRGRRQVAQEEEHRRALLSEEVQIVVDAAMCHPHLPSRTTGHAELALGGLVSVTRS